MKKNINLALLTPQQETEIRREISDLERMIIADRQLKTPKIQDETEFRANIQKKKKLLDDHTPRPLRPKEKDQAAKRVKELDKIIAEHMPRKKDYYRRATQDMDFERAVNQQMVFQQNKQLQGMILERKHLLGRLEPQDPHIRNIENLRK